MDMNYRTDINDGLAIYEATALHAVANDLYTSLNILSNPKTCKSTDEETKRLIGYSISIVMLRALAVELTLKALAFRRTGKFKGIHDLLELYDDLDTDTQALISKIKDVHGVVPVRCILEKHKDDFVAWRYLDLRDGNNLQVQLKDLVRALDVLFLVYEGT